MICQMKGDSKPEYEMYLSLKKNNLKIKKI